MLAALTLIALSLLLHGPTATLPPQSEHAAALQWLARAQRLSFATDREYCGYLGRTAEGEIGFTQMQRGGHDGCTPLLPDTGLKLIASMHTHGAYDPDVPAEFPTALDIASDAREGVNGYISTPGGRLWYVDGAAQVAIQLCGLGCMPQDPAFHAGDDGSIRMTYSRAQLLRLEASH